MRARDRASDARRWISEVPFVPLQRGVDPDGVREGFVFDALDLLFRASVALSEADAIPTAFHNTEQYANNRVECNHGRLKARLRPMRGLKRDHTAQVIIRGHALMQNIRRGHYELGVDAGAHRRIEHAFTELAQTI